MAALEKGDLLILPAGIWHRFSTDEGNVSFFFSLTGWGGREGEGRGLMKLAGTQYVKAVRLFKDEPKWTALNRAPELEENRYRKEYVAAVKAATAG